MSKVADRAKCGPYELFAPDGEQLDEAGDGSLIVFAEVSYLVRFAPGATRDVLKGALRVPRHGTEGTLRFGNFIGRASLGGRDLQVRSRRLDVEAATEMLDQVSAWLGSLPLGWAGSTSAAYSTRREASPEVLYHAFALIRDAYRRLDQRDLRAAIERILALPHESLERGEPHLVALGAASRVDADTLVAVPQLAENLRSVPRGSPLADGPAAQALGGVLPDLLRVRPFTESTDNPENRYVAHLLEDMVDVLLRFMHMVRARDETSATVNLREAGEIADFLSRCRRHRVLADVRAEPRMPRSSAVLRRKPGYRELLKLHTELDERLQTASTTDVQRLLESRDAADVYEYWCFIRLLGALEAKLGPPHSIDPFEASEFQSQLRRGYRASWPQLTATYNDTFPSASGADFKPSVNSYSLGLRPDIVLRWEADGRLDIFDAKLKIHFVEAAATDEDDEGTLGERFKPADLHKMHAYRDALGASSVWVLYPGDALKPEKFRAPTAAGERTVFSGVGAIALRPGASDGGLVEVLDGILEHEEIQAEMAGAVHG